MSSCQAGKPNEHTGIARAEANAPFDARHSVLGLTPRIKHDTKYGVSRRKARIELDRFLELSHRAIGARSPHADQSQREMSIWVASIEGDRALRQLEGFLEVSFGILRPA